MNKRNLLKVTPESIEAGARNQQKLLEAIGNGVSDLAGFDIDAQAVRAGGYTVALLLLNLDEVLGAPELTRVENDVCWPVPRETPAMTRVARRAGRCKYDVYSFPPPNQVLARKIGVSVQGAMQGGFVLRSWKSGWHLDDFSGRKETQSMNFWRQLRGATIGRFALPQRPEDLSGLDLWTPREVREATAHALPLSDEFIFESGDAVIFPGHSVVDVESGVVDLAGTAHVFSTARSPRESYYSSISTMQ